MLARRIGEDSAVPSLVLADPLPYSPARFYWRGDASLAHPSVVDGSDVDDAPTCWLGLLGEPVYSADEIADYEAQLHAARRQANA